MIRFEQKPGYSLLDSILYMPILNMNTGNLIRASHYRPVGDFITTGNVRIYGICPC